MSKRFRSRVLTCCPFSARWPAQRSDTALRELAAKAGVSPDTVFRLEKGEALHQRTGIGIREALEDAGVLLQLRKRSRSTASLSFTGAAAIASLAWTRHRQAFGGQPSK